MRLLDLLNFFLPLFLTFRRTRWDCVCPSDYPVAGSKRKRSKANKKTARSKHTVKLMN